MALDVIANKTWDEIDKTWDEFTRETWNGWVEFCYALKIYDTGGVKVAEITGDFKNPTLTEFKFKLLQQGGCGAFSFTLAEPYTQATIDYNYRVEVYIFNPQVLFFTGKIINKPIKGTEKLQTYSGYGYFNELEKKIIDTEISPGNDIAIEVVNILDTHIIPYTNILKDADLIETVNHDLVATIDFEDEYAKEVFNRLRELAVDYKFGVNEERKFYFQPIDTSIKYYWHIGKHLTKFHPEENLSDLVKKVIAVYPEVFSDGYRLKIESEANDYNGLYEKRFSLPEIVNPFSSTNLASGKVPTTNPVGTGAANLCDGDYSTLWESGTNQASGHYIEVDLGTDYENISAVVIDSIHANAKDYNAKSIKIEIKPDGGEYETMLSSNDDVGWKPEITFRPTTGRYVKISLTQSSDEEWKVGEIEIYQLDLTDAQRWADWKLSTLENVKKRATARITNVQELIMNSAGLLPIKPEGKARIFDENGTKIDDYQITACEYSLSSGGFNLDLELGDVRTIADPIKDLERRIRENENSGVRRAKNLSLSKGFQLSQIKGTYIGPNEIQTKHFAAKSVLANQIAVVGIDSDGKLVLSQIGSGDTDNIPEGTNKFAAEHGADITGNHTADDTSKVDGETAANIHNWADDPAARINAKFTLIEPGKITISGGTTLEDWRHPTDTTTIDGGKIYTNTVTANKLSITDLIDIANKLTLASGRVIIDKDAFGTNLEGIKINDGTYNRVEIGELTSGNYGATLRDANGTVWCSLGKLQQVWQKVYDAYTTTNCTQISVSGLHGNTDQQYYVMFSAVNVSGTNPGFRLRFNNDTGNNYGYLFDGFAEGAQSGGQYTNISSWWLIDVNSTSERKGIAFLIIEAKTGSVRTGTLISQSRGYGTTVDANYAGGEIWNNTSSEITSIQVFSTVTNGIKAGAHLSIYKIPAY